eukprot:124761-Rhodomonas_salina.1
MAAGESKLEERTLSFPVEGVATVEDSDADELPGVLGVLPVDYGVDRLGGGPGGAGGSQTF